MKEKKFTNTQMAQSLEKMMNEFDRTRKLWKAMFGTTDGHGEWFRQQLDIFTGAETRFKQLQRQGGLQ